MKATKFQSLFSWSYLSKKTRLFFCPLPEIVSILIFLELPFKVNLQYLHNTIYFEFQSLFSWSYLSKNL